MKKPNTQQEFELEKSDINPGLTVIEASAGTGKTFVISHLLPRLLLEGKIDSLREALLVSFTNDATRELSDRVRRVLLLLADDPAPNEPERHPGVHLLRNSFPPATVKTIIGKALREMDQLSVSTIHSFCQHVLVTEGILCGLPVMPEVVTDLSGVLEQYVRDFWQLTAGQEELVASILQPSVWNMNKDIELATIWMRRQTMHLEPTPSPLPDTCQEIQRALQMITDEDIDGVERILKANPVWNLDYNQEVFKEKLNTLRLFRGEPVTYAASGWEAVSGLLNLPSGINGHSCKALKQAANDLPIRKKLEVILSLKSRLLWAWQSNCAASVKERINLHLRQRRQITFDGLVGSLRRALEGPRKKVLIESLRRHYRLALVDESQDTDPDQFAIFSHIFLGSTEHYLVLIGDPKQSIYAFRDADLETYLAARKQAQKVYTLTTTFRAPRALVTAINSFFSPPGAFLHPGIAYPSACSGLAGDVQLLIEDKVRKTRIEAWMVPEKDAPNFSNHGKRMERIGDALAHEIVRLLQNGKIRETDPRGQVRQERSVQAGDIAILVSSHREVASIQDTLRAKGVLAIVRSSGDVLHSPMAGEIHLLLRAIAEPRRAGTRYAALATRLLGMTSADLRELREKNLEADERWLETFDRWLGFWLKHGVARLLALLDAEQQITARLAALPDGERHLTDFRHLEDLLQQETGSQSNRPEYVLRWMSRERHQATPQERQLQLESDRLAVQIVTMHAAKGLEYPLVFCPFLWATHNLAELEWLRQSAPGSVDKLVQMTAATEETKLRMIRMKLQESLRLAYVAMTRAKVHLWILGGSISRKRKTNDIPSALDWLLRNQDEIVTDDSSWREWYASWKNSQFADSPGIAAITKAAKPFLVVKEPPLATDISHQRTIPEASSAARALPEPDVAKPWLITSFTALTKEKPTYGESETASAPVLETAVDTTLSAEPLPLPLHPFATFPSSAAVGTVLHELLEGWDFRSCPKLLLTRAVPLLPRSRDHAVEVPEMLADLLDQLSRAVLPGLDAPLAEAVGPSHSAEWQFYLPLRNGFNMEKLADIFLREGSEIYQRYAGLLVSLAAQDLRGYLQGYIDRLVCHHGKWGVIDWKSNRLGQETTVYDPEQLLHCAMESHYFLQCHLYLVALRRYLKISLSTGQASLAGAWLVFLRGVQGGTSRGILHLQPSTRLLEQLDELFSTPD